MRRGGALYEWAVVTAVVGGLVAIVGKIMFDYMLMLDAAVIKAVGL